MQVHGAIWVQLTAFQFPNVPHRGHVRMCTPVPGGGLQNILRHFAFVKPRFESFVGPRRKYICLLQAIVMLLASVAGDARLSRTQRTRAEEALDAMTPEDILANGLAGDFGEECLSFLRQFDVDDHDPAMTAQQKASFKRTLDVLFRQGGIYAKQESLTAEDQNCLASALQGAECSAGSHMPQEPVGVVPACGDAPAGGHVPIPAPPNVVPRTLTQIALEQMDATQVFYYGEKVKVLWNGTTHRKAKELLASMQDVVQDTVARLDADFFHGDLVICFEIFDLGVWERLGTSPEDHKDIKTQSLHRKLRKLARALSLQGDPLKAYWEQALPCALRERHRIMKARNGLIPDNREVWAAFLDPTFGSQAGLGLTLLQRLIRFYLSVLDGTGAIERGLGRHARICQQHLGSTGGDALEVYMDGPGTEADLFTTGPGGELLLTPFSRLIASLWVKIHGRRFAVYKSRTDKGIKKVGHKFLGSDRAVQAGPNVVMHACSS